MGYDMDNVGYLKATKRFPRSCNVWKRVQESINVLKKIEDEVLKETDLGEEQFFSLKHCYSVYDERAPYEAFKTAQKTKQLLHQKFRADELHIADFQDF